MGIQPKEERTEHSRSNIQMGATMMSGCRGGEENSHGKRSLNQKDNPWAGMDSRPREVNYLNIVSTSSGGLTYVDLPGPESSG